MWTMVTEEKREKIRRQEKKARDRNLFISKEYFLCSPLCNSISLSSSFSPLISIIFFVTSTP